MRAGRLTITALVVLSGLATGSPAAEESGSFYRRAARPQFNTKTLRGKQTRLVFEEMDLKNQVFVARVVRDREVLHEMEFRFLPPPMDIRVAQPFELAVTLRIRPVSSQAVPERTAEVEVTLTPNEKFSVSGNPIKMPPTAFRASDLMTASPPTVPNPFVTQQIILALMDANANHLTCGYTVRLGWENELHEVRLVYPFRLKKGMWWARSAVGLEDVPGTASSGPVAESAPTTPWRDETRVRLFALYLAEVNHAIRAQRGSEFAVDAWGREVGPATTLPVCPPGSWENPNHYLWIQNAHYEGVPLSVREFIADRSQAIPE